MADYKFDTIQLHAGQERPTRRQMREQFRSMQRHHMFFTTVPMPRQGLVFRQKEIFTAG